jgi:hypothetical protein
MRGALAGTVARPPAEPGGRGRTGVRRRPCGAGSPTLDAHGRWSPFVRGPAAESLEGAIFGKPGIAAAGGPGAR